MYLIQALGVYSINKFMFQYKRKFIVFLVMLELIKPRGNNFFFCMQQQDFQFIIYNLNRPQNLRESWKNYPIYKKRRI